MTSGPNWMIIIGLAIVVVAAIALVIFWKSDG